jgi:tRNA dimethylallyltransferase
MMKTSAEQRKLLIVILGPTAVGKTAYSIEVAKHYSTEIISCDSRQIFQELNIGVARPSRDELSAVPTHFIASRSIHESYSAGQFAMEAHQLLSRLFEQHDKVICCGGSMLYIDALLHGFDDLPSDEIVREQLNQRLKKEGLETLQEELKSMDSEYHAEVDLSNPHRVMRALEVCIVSGKKYSELRTGARTQLPYAVCKIGLKLDRNELRKRIDARVDQMFESGLVEEVKTMQDFRHLQSLNTVGYKELFDYFDGRVSLDEARELIKIHTAQFAKRQMTWWKRDASIHWISPSDIDQVNGVWNSLLTEFG